MTEIHTHSIWFPNFTADTILDIGTDTLKAAGITHIVFDLDNTLIKHRNDTISPEYVHFIKWLQEGGFKVTIATNSPRDITALSKSLGVHAVRPKGPSRKPSGSFYTRVISASGAEPNHIAMVGNHILNDIIGANRVGLTTILVKPLGHTLPLAYRFYSTYIWIVRRLVR